MYVFAVDTLATCILDVDVWELGNWVENMLNDLNMAMTLIILMDISHILLDKNQGELMLYEYYANEVLSSSCPCVRLHTL